MTPLSNSHRNAKLQPRPTIRHVAALAGVGTKTVSRVINGEPNVSPATAAKVLEAAQSLHYRPDLHAGNLRRSDRKTKTLGLLVGNVGNPFAGAVHRAIENAAAMADWPTAKSRTPSSTPCWPARTAAPGPAAATTPIDKASELCTNVATSCCMR